MNRYKTIMRKNFPDDRPLYVFLTPDGDGPSDTSWMPYSYEYIFRVLHRTLDMHQNAIGDEVRVFLEHYLILLRSRFMNDKQLDELCQRIYKNHRQALDVIWERVGSSDSHALDVVANIVEQDERWELIWHSSRYINFTPTTWLEWLPPSDDYYQFNVHLRMWEGKLAFVLFIGPMGSDALRENVVMKLRELCPKCGFKRTRASTIGGKWNRICSRETVVEWDDEEEPETDEFREKVEAKIGELYSKLEKLGIVFRPLCN